MNENNVINFNDFRIQGGHDAREIANAFIELGLAKNQTSHPLSIIKLVCIAHGWMLGLYGKPLSAQPVLVGNYGPVIADVVNMVGRGKEIKETFKEFDVDGKDFTAQERDIVEEVYAGYGSWTALQLSGTLNKEGTPYKNMFNKLGMSFDNSKPQFDKTSKILPNSLIGKYYKELIEKYCKELKEKPKPSNSL